MAISASFSPVFFLRRHDAVAILFRVAEFQRIGGLHACPHLGQAALIEQGMQARACFDITMMTALGADHQIGLKLRAIQHRAAATALFPHAFGHRTFADVALCGTGPRVHDFLQPVHRITACQCGLVDMDRMVESRRHVTLRRVIPFER